MKTDYSKRNSKSFKVRIHKTAQHFYAQLIDSTGNVKYTYSTLGIKSLLRKEGKDISKNFLNTSFVRNVGLVFSDKLKELALESCVYYDRGSNRYTGLVQIFADVLRDNGISI